MQKLVLLSAILFIIPFLCASNFQKGSITIPLKNNDDILYTDLLISSTRMKVLLNTGSNEVWVPAVGCDRRWCKGKKKFDHDKSPSYQTTNKTFVSEFGGTRLKGRVGMDDVKLGNISTKALEFGEAVKSLDDFVYLYYDGSLGLGPKAESTVGTSYLQRLLKSEETDDIVFSFSLKEKLGYLTIGSIDNQMYKGSLIWSKIVREDRWQIKADSISLDTISLCNSTCQVEFDTGIEITVAPPDAAVKLFNLLGATEIQGTSIRSVECSEVAKFPDLVFSIAGKKVSLSPKDYVRKKKMWQHEVCWLSITWFEGIDRWVIGAPEHSSLHVVYDYGRKAIGLAHV